MATCSISDLMEEAACAFTLDGPGQWEAVKLALLCRILKTLDPMATCDVSALMADAKCFFPVVSAGMGQALELQLLCNIATAGAGGGTPQVFSGAGDPVGLQTGQNPAKSAIYYNNSTGEEFPWDIANGVWIRV